MYSLHVQIICGSFTSIGLELEISKEWEEEEKKRRKGRGERMQKKEAEKATEEKEGG